MSETNYAPIRILKEKLREIERNKALAAWTERKMPDEVESEIAQLEEAITKLEGDGWIDPNKRKPTKEDADQYGEVFVMDKGGECSADKWNSMLGVMYWMPIPKPPKQDQ